MIFNKLINIYFLTEYNNGDITRYDHHSYSNMFIINLIMILFMYAVLCHGFIVDFVVIYLCANTLLYSLASINPIPIVDTIVSMLKKSIEICKFS